MILKAWTLTAVMLHSTRASKPTDSTSKLVSSQPRYLALGTARYSNVVAMPDARWSTAIPTHFTSQGYPQTWNRIIIAPEMDRACRERGGRNPGLTSDRVDKACYREETKCAGATLTSVAKHIIYDVTRPTVATLQMRFMAIGSNCDHHDTLVVLKIGENYVDS